MCYDGAEQVKPAIIGKEDLNV